MEEHFLSFSAKLIKNIIFRGQDFVSLCLLKKEKKNKKSTTQGGPCQFEFYRFRNNFFQDSVKQFYSIINFTNKNGKLSYFAFEYSQMQVINSNHTSKRAGMGVQNFNNNHFMYIRFVVVFVVARFQLQELDVYNSSNSLWIHLKVWCQLLVANS
eukprot:TRINITY_DN3015_c0_g1_i5.p7 TRINITY_DN3015_c0_g1~~TRINITY_DN3015_c0_g1_i5.p7  ORF type:complete len:155 (-),score=5.91 TRINITY_DN3015_c0_g1_i5:214-678(-)